MQVFIHTFSIQNRRRFKHQWYWRKKNGLTSRWLPVAANQIKVLTSYKTQAGGIQVRRAVFPTAVCAAFRLSKYQNNTKVMFHFCLFFRNSHNLISKFAQSVYPDIGSTCLCKSNQISSQLCAFYYFLVF